MRVENLLQEVQKGQTLQEMSELTD